MNDQQMLSIALTILPTILPTMITVFIGILINNSRLCDLNDRIVELRSDMNDRFEQVDRRFEESKDLWRSELHRVEGILDARLQHFEQR